MDKWEDQLEKLAGEFKIDLSEFNNLKPHREDDKKMKKKIKKYTIQKEDSVQSGIQKTIKLLDEIGKNYENASKQKAKVKRSQETLVYQQNEKLKAQQQKQMIQGLHQSFMKKYHEQLKRAQQVEKQEEEKRKKLVEQLQKKIETVQNKYKEAGQVKIQKFREHQTLTHEIQKLEPHLTASESLFDAQLKKKEIEMQIQMTTMKQKIEMMNNFKSIGSETQAKIDKAKEDQEKIKTRLGVLQGKEEEHKLLMARAHLVMQQYKKAIIKINELLKKKQRQAVTMKEKVVSNEDSLRNLDKTLINLDKEYETQIDQLKGLENLEKDLKKQLGE